MAKHRRKRKHDRSGEPIGRPDSVVAGITCRCGTEIPREAAQQDGTAICPGCGEEWRWPRRIICESELDVTTPLIEACKRLADAKPTKVTLDELRIMLANKIQTDKALKEALGRLKPIQADDLHLLALVDVLPLASEVRSILMARERGQDKPSADLAWLEKTFGDAFELWDNLENMFRR